MIAIKLLASSRAVCPASYLVCTETQGAAARPRPGHRGQVGRPAQIQLGEGFRAGVGQVGTR